MPSTTASLRPPIVIPADKQQAISAAISTLLAELQPYLQELGAADRKALAKMGDKSEAFVGKAFMYMQANPQLRPSFLDIEAMGLHLAAVDLLRGYLGPLQQLTDMLSDSEMYSGSEAMNGALIGYEASKAAARRNQPGASIIAEELSARFPGRSQKAARPTNGA